MAPIFTPARSIPEAETNVTITHEEHDIPVQTFSPEQTKEAFDVARNSIELLSTVLTSSPQHDVVQVQTLFSSFLLSCLLYIL